MDTKNLMIIITGIFLISVWMHSLYNIFLDIFIAPFFGFVCNSFSLFGYTFVRAGNDKKWSHSFQKLSLICQSTIILDASKPIPRDAEKKSMIFTLTEGMVFLLTAVCLLILNKDAVLKIFDVGVLVGISNIDSTELFWASILIGLCIHGIIHIFIFIYSFFILTKRLNGYTQSAINKLRSGVSFEMLNLKPIEQLPYKNATQLEKVMYYKIYLPYLLETGNIEAMKAPVYEMTKYFMVAEYILSQTLNYYWLIFYYSRFEIHKLNADTFYEKVKATIESDPDANAKRVLAYYHYGIRRDEETAKRYIREGLSVINSFGVPGAEREQERRLLTELEELICRREQTKLQNAETRP